MIIFYNFFHNGDIYLNIPFLIYISKQLKTQINFYVKTSTNLIDNTYINLLPINNLLSNLNININYNNLLHTDIINIDKNILINNWIHPYWKYNKDYKLNIDGYLDIYNNHIFPKIGVPNNYDIYNFIPNIIYPNIKENINIDNNSVLICNGRCLSGQMPDFSMDELIIQLQKNFTVVTTHKSYINNVTSFEEIYPFDNNISNLPIIYHYAKYFKYIIGKDSGLFQWCFNINTIDTKYIYIKKDCINNREPPVSHIFKNIEYINFNSNNSIMFNHILDIIN